ncbi:MAG: 30S ribosomal protein S20, partial [Bacilli bacterium]|nr:30S ribosomal protein S20 [Bacilli bacterium]
MPNIKSQKKRDKTNKASNASNSSRKNEIRTAIKKVEVLA